MSYNTWQKVKLGDLGRIITGKTPRTTIPDNYGDEVLFLTPSDDMSVKKIYDTKKKLSLKGLSEVKNCLIPGDTVCVSCIGSDLGKVVMTTRPCITNQQINSIVPNDKYDSNFLYYSLVILGRYINHLSKTSTAVPIVNKTAFSNFTIDLPPLGIQKAIADILSSFDDKIEINNRINKTLKEMAQAIFKRWFVDYEFPDENGNPYKSSGGEMVESELGLIPRGWITTTIQDVCEINTWSITKRDSFRSIRYIEISEVMRGVINNISEYKYGEEPSRARRRLRHGDTVLSTVRPDRGSYFLCLNPEENLIASTGFAVITPKKIPWSLLFPLLSQDEVFEHLGSVADGGAYPAVRPDVIGQWSFAIPNSNALLDAFHKYCSVMYAQIDVLRRENTILATIRDTLLPRLMRGEFL